MTRLFLRRSLDFKSGVQSALGVCLGLWKTHSTTALSACFLFAALVMLGLAQPLLSLYCAALWGMTCPAALRGQVMSYFNRQRRYQFSPVVSLSLTAGLTTGLVLLSGSFSPAQAQFLQSAEQAATELTSGLGGGTDISPVITFIFGALRLLLIVYMAVALIQIVNSARQGEEWKDLARTPLLIVLVVIIGDFIANIVVGGGGAAV